MTREVVKLAHPYGVSVEGELGVLAGVEDHVFSATSTYTNPMQAVDFFKKTGCDALPSATAPATARTRARTRRSAAKSRLRRRNVCCTRALRGYLVSHGSSTVPQEYVQGINALGGQLENAFGIDVAQLVDVAHCGINKINVDTDIRLACTRNLLELFENEPELRESASIGQLYKDLKKNPKNFDPRNYVASIMDTITLGTVPDAHVQKVVDCMKDGVTESIAPLLVQFGSYRKSHLIEVVTCEQMAERQLRRRAFDMKHIFLNLKRFDISPEKGGVNRLAPMKDWGRAIVSGTQDALTAYDPAEVEFVMYMPEAHLLGAAAAKTENSPVQLGCQGVYRADTAVGGNFGAFTTNRPANAAAQMGCASTLIGHCGGAQRQDGDSGRGGRDGAGGDAGRKSHPQPGDQVRAGGRG